MPAARHWVLADARLRLLSIGTDLYSGQSARSYLDSAARLTLLPMFQELVSGRETVPHKSVRCPDGRRRVWHARSLRGPSGGVHAVLGSHIDEREGSAVDPPIVGAWEWDVPRLVTRWSADLFRVYGYAITPHDHGWWEAPEFFDLLEIGQRAQMRTVLERFHHAPPDELIIHSFEARHARSGEIQRLRLAGRTVWEHGAARWFRGVTMRIDGYEHADVAEPGRDDVFAAALSLSTHPMCLVDVTDHRVYLRTARWQAAGLADPPHGRLTSAVHPDDVHRLMTTLAEASASSQRPATCTVRFATTSGWQDVDVWAASVVIRYSGFERPHALIKLRM